jgi:alcohol dehydrogenase (NADP+)
MLCAGITMYSPLVRNGAGPGKKVAIVGLGGLGHFGVLFAKALGAETWVISRTHSKEEDAKKMGADGFLATADKGWNEPHKSKSSFYFPRSSMEALENRRRSHSRHLAG